MSQRLSTQRRIPTWIAIAAASVPVFMATLDNLVVTSALPAIHQEMGASVEDLQWITNAFTLSFASFLLIAVSLGDRFGRRGVFVGGIVLFTAASVACAVSGDPTSLVAWRAVQGAGAAAITPLSLTLLVGSVPLRSRSLAIGIWSGVSGLGVALGPLVGGAAVEGWNWQAIFWINLPVGLVSIPLAILALPNTSFRSSARIDFPSMLLVGGAILGVVYGIVRGNEVGWTSTQVVGSIVAGIVALALFIWRQSRSLSPLVPLRLFRDRSFALANVVGLIFSFGAFGAVFILIQFMQIVQGRSPLEAGILTMPWTLAPMIVAPLAGLVAPRVGTRVLLSLGLASLSAGILWMAYCIALNAPYLQQLPGFVLAGLGMGLVFAPLSTAVLANMTQRDHGTASGVSSMVREVGVALGIAVLTAVFTGAGGELTAAGYVDAAVPAVLVGGCALAVASGLAWFMPSGRMPAAARGADDLVRASSDSLSSSREVL